MASPNDWDGDGIPNYIDATPGRPSTTGGGTITPPVAGVNFIPDGETEENTVRLPNGTMVTPSQFKQWIQVQKVNNTFEWRQYQAAMQSIGFKKDSDILAALSKGADYTSYYGSGTTDPLAYSFGIGGPERSGGGGGGGGGPFSQSQTSVSLSSASEAAGIADRIFQEELGRRASDAELRAFQRALNEAEKANPAQVTTQGTTSGRNTTSSTTSRGGFDPSRFATEYAQSMPDYAENFAASTFMDRLSAVIRNPSVIADRVGGID